VRLTPLGLLAGGRSASAISFITSSAIRKAVVVKTLPVAFVFTYNRFETCFFSKKSASYENMYVWLKNRVYCNIYTGLGGVGGGGVGSV
jgi:hypothetical protein